MVWQAMAGGALHEPYEDKPWCGVPELGIGFMRFTAKPGGRYRVLRRLGAIAAGLVFLRLMFWWFERANVYHPHRSWGTDGSELGVSREDVRFQAPDGVDLSGWFLRAASGGGCSDRVILFCHGNGGNISHRCDSYRFLLGLGVDVFAFDYRGYGRSSGRPTEEGTYADAEGALAWLSTRGYAADRVVAFGESLGGAVAAELALRNPGIGGLVLQSTFTSIPDLGAELFPMLPVRWIATIRYDTHAKLPRVGVPVLILHSRGDTLVRYAHAESNYAAAREPKWLRDIRGDHNDQPAADPESFTSALGEFLAAVRNRGR